MSDITQRYSRQVLFPAIGPAGQHLLASSRVLVVGCGALGSSHAEMLARAGVGHLRIVDRDFVELTNLQRQTLFNEADAENRLPKAIAARERIALINSEVTVEPIIADINNSNIESLLDGCDLAIDGTDNFQIRYLLNDACVKHGVKWIYGAAVSSYGSTMTVIPGKTPCLRCIFADMPEVGSAPTCDTAGVIMPIISTVSAAQVAEALKILVGDLGSLHGSLMQFDVWANDLQKIRLGAPDPDCVACGARRFEFLDADRNEFAAVLCGRHAVQIAPPIATSIDLESLSARLQVSVPVRANEYLLRFTAGENEITVFRDGRAIIMGTDDISAARSLYSRFIGS